MVFPVVLVHPVEDVLASVDDVPERAGDYHNAVARADLLQVVVVGHHFYLDGVLFVDVLNEVAALADHEAHGLLREHEFRGGLIVVAALVAALHVVYDFLHFGDAFQDALLLALDLHDSVLEAVDFAVHLHRNVVVILNLVQILARLADDRGHRGVGHQKLQV